MNPCDKTLRTSDSISPKWFRQNMLTYACQATSTKESIVCMWCVLIHVYAYVYTFYLCMYAYVCIFYLHMYAYIYSICTNMHRYAIGQKLEWITSTIKGMRFGKLLWFTKTMSALNLINTALHNINTHHIHTQPYFADVPELYMSVSYLCLWHFVHIPRAFAFCGCTVVLLCLCVITCSCCILRTYLELVYDFGCMPVIFDVYVICIHTFVDVPGTSKCELPWRPFAPLTFFLLWTFWEGLGALCTWLLNRVAASVLQSVAECCSVLQCVAVCCSVLQCVAVCCSVLQCVAVWCSVLQSVAVCCSMLQCVTVCGVLQSVAVCCRVLRCVAVCYSVLQCVAVCCSVLQCVAVCCSVL